jgi:hypothetical protein
MSGKKMKQTAERRVLALEKWHVMLEITRMESSMFRKERGHNKIVLLLARIKELE